MSETTRVEAASPTDRQEGSYVDWSAVLAGAITAAALFFLLVTFGSAVGLSVVSPWSGTNPSAETLGIITAAWFIAIQISSFAAGGYIAGRMRRRFGNSTEDESDFRDGAHGLLVWAAGLVFSVLLVASTATSLVTAGVQGGAQAAGQAVGSMGGEAVNVDMLFRANRPPPENADVQAEARRILARGLARGELSQQDRTYLAQLVAARTGLNPQEAEQRVQQVVTEARQAADTARRTGVLTAFLTAASLLVSLATAWLAAAAGGNHRDQGTVWRGLRRDFPLPPLPGRRTTSAG